MCRIEAMAATAIDRDPTGSGCIRNKRAPCRLHDRKATLTRPPLARKGIVPTGIEDDDVDSIVRILDRAQDAPRWHGLVRHVLFPADTGPHGKEVILAIHLYTMPGKVKGSLRSQSVTTKRLQKISRRAMMYSPRRMLRGCVG